MPKILCRGLITGKKSELAHRKDSATRRDLRHHAGMTPNVESRRTGAARTSDRGGARRVPAAGRRGSTGRAGGAEAAVDQAAVGEGFGDWEGAAFDLTPRAQPAALLFAMIERMGGTATSHWKGKYVNLSI